MTQPSILLSLLLLGAVAVTERPPELEPVPADSEDAVSGEENPSLEVPTETNTPPAPPIELPAAEESLDLETASLTVTGDTNLTTETVPDVLVPPEVEISPSNAVPTLAPPALTKEEWLEISRESLAPTVDALSSRLSTLEQMLVVQHQDALTASQGTTRTILLVAGSFATAVLFGVLLGALILARAVQKLAGMVVAALPSGRPIGRNPSLSLPPDSSELIPSASGPVEQVTHRFLGTIEKLEKRIVELEHTARDAAQGLPGTQPNGGSSPASGGNGGPLEFSVTALHQKQYGELPSTDTAAEPEAHDEAALWIGKGQALLNLGSSEQALACFEKAVEAGPRHAADAYVKRGMALERMEKIEDAVASYDQAIAADGSMTLAYLYKGAACNRLQRYREALDCYEIALKCEQKLAEH